MTRNDTFSRHRRSMTSILACKLTQELGPLGERVVSMIARSDLRPLLDPPQVPELLKDYSDTEEFRDAYQAVSLLSKFPFAIEGVDRAAAALQKFREAEEHCLETNIRLSKPNSLPCEVVDLITRTRRKIGWILGPFSWDQAEQYMDFGPGATTRLPRARGDVYYKMQGKLHTTFSNLIPSAAAVYRVPRWWESITGRPHSEGFDVDLFVRSVEVVEGSKVTTVPKNAKTDRVIAIEPDLNMFVQKGIGGLIRRRLKRVGCDLDSQKWNQVLAAIGSLDDDIATLDLSSASDSVSLGLCEALLPDDWLAAIKLCRSQFVRLPSGEKLLLRKVSSMGNGFTFELESLIFWALVLAVVPVDELGLCAVYGDDIVVPTAYSGLVSRALVGFGFTLNEEKSFVSGPFRESCGKHYHNGEDVTPVYIRKDIRTTHHLFWFANQVRRWARRPTYGLRIQAKTAYDTAVSLLPAGWRRPTIPDGMGDGALFGDFDEARPPTCPKARRRGLLARYRTRLLAPVPDELIPEDEFMLLRYLHVKRNPVMGNRWRPAYFGRSIEDGFGYSQTPLGVEDLAFLDRLIQPRRVPEYRLVKPVVAEWPSYGQWL